MKKNLLIILFAAIASFANAQGVCTPDPNCQTGLCPDTVVNLPEAVVNSLPAYSTTITAVVPNDTIAVIGQAGIDSARLRMDSIMIINYNQPNLNLPPGIAVACNGTSNPNPCTFYMGTNDCMKLTGTVQNLADTGEYDLFVLTQAYVTCMETWPPTVFGQPGCPILQGILDNQPDLLTDTVLGYRINVKETSSSVNQIKSAEFTVSQNAPNPFTKITTINFTNNNNGRVIFTMYNMLGETVYNENVSSSKGQNIILFNAKELPSGIYSYSLNNGEKTISKRMILAEN